MAGERDDIDTVAEERSRRWAHQGSHGQATGRLPRCRAIHRELTLARGAFAGHDIHTSEGARR